MNHFHFQSNTQKDGETLITFCNHVLLEAKHCNFKCIAEDAAVRDQIIIRLESNDIEKIMGFGYLTKRRYENGECCQKGSRDQW